MLLREVGFSIPEYIQNLVRPPAACLCWICSKQRSGIDDPGGPLQMKLFPEPLALGQLWAYLAELSKGR